MGESRFQDIYTFFFFLDILRLTLPIEYVGIEFDTKLYCLSYLLPL